VPRLIRSPDAARRHPRAGVTLIELLITLLMFSIVLGAIISVFSSQQRIYARTREAADVQRDLRTGFSMLPADLRAAAPRPVPGLGNSDLGELSDSGLSVRATIGQSIVCEKNTGAMTNLLVLPPRNLARHTLTTWHAIPQPGDLVLIYDDNLAKGPEDDYWVERSIIKIDTVAACTGTPERFVDAALDAGKPRLRVQLDAAVDTTVRIGAGVRFVRWARYSLFQPTLGVSQWYLGYSEAPGNGVLTAREPIAGPFRPYAASNSGIAFRYYDVTGTELTAPVNPQNVARIDLTLRAQARVRGNGLSTTTVQDSIAMRVALRNR
jgi:prepilin-type N-terminal cleavage/methylation domain-containing protein